MGGITEEFISHNWPIVRIQVSPLFTKVDAACSQVYPDYRQLLKYLAVGAISTTINLLVFYLILRTMSFMDLYVNIVSYHAGMFVSYYLNRVFTFRSAYEKIHLQLARFVIVAYSQFLIVELVLFIVAHLVFHSNAIAVEMISNMIAVAVGFVYAYTINKRFTFRIRVL
jgi:putative flippase GtrA